MTFFKFLETVLIIYFFYYLFVVLIEKAKKKNVTNDGTSVIYAVQHEEHSVTNVINEASKSTEGFKESDNTFYKLKENVTPIIEGDYDLSLEMIDSELLGFNVTAENLIENFQNFSF